jgi:primosomal protein N' (replication factor Y)
MQQLTIDDIQKIIPNASAWKVINGLVEKGIVQVYDDVRESFVPKKETVLYLFNDYKNEENLRQLLTQLSKAPKQENSLLTFLHLQQTEGKVFQKKLIEQAQVTQAVVKAMCDKNIFTQHKVQVDRITYDTELVTQDTLLSKHQQTAFEDIKKAFAIAKPVLLHGITGSGKTHIYFKLIEEKVAEQKQILYLLPEIALTTQIVQKLQQTFGDTIGVYHSKYSNNERYELWNKVKNGTCKIIIGARSALFLPFKNLGLVIVDEEHDSSYKQYDPSPRYQARDSAVFLASLFKANIILGSATPSLESYQNTLHKKYAYVQLTERFGNAILPEVQLIDLKKCLKEKTMEGIFSRDMLDAIKTTILKGEQVILFQNRRGYSPFVQCTTCAWIPECKYCDVSLTYHKQTDKMHCHYCGNKYNYTVLCEACGGNKIIAKSFGTEKIEEEIKLFFPHARVARFDWDALRTKNKYTELIQQFEQKKIDILVGTQMVVKGLDFEHVSLVGVLSADSLLSFPDYKTNERVFQLLEQVSGRAGRKNIKGNVMIQAYDTNRSTLAYVKLHDVSNFIKEELEIRKEFLYPPFSRLIKLTIKNKVEHLAEQCAINIANELRAIPKTWIVGPAAPAIARIKNYYLQEILIKFAKDTATILEVKKEIKRIILEQTAPKIYAATYVVIDVDA